MPSGAAQRIDDNGRTLRYNEDYILSSTWTFVAGTTGAIGTHTLFTVTGDVIVSLFGICKTNIDAGGTCTADVGIAGDTAGIIDRIGNFQNVAADETAMHTDQQTSSPTVRFAFAGAAPVADSEDIILTIGSEAVTAGVMTFYCLWRPLSSDGDIKVVTPA